MVIKWKPEGPPPCAVPQVAKAPRSEQRFHDRLPVKYRFSIYSNEKGGQHCISARGINMSRSGALVETEEPIGIGSMIYIQTPELGLMGSASVRHCTAKGSKFRIGLHFPSPLMRRL